MNPPRHLILVLPLLLMALPRVEAGAQVLQIHPQSLDFGIVKIGVRLQERVLLKNSGEADLEVLVRLQGDQFTASPDTLLLEGPGRGIG